MADTETKTEDSDATKSNAMEDLVFSESELAAIKRDLGRKHAVKILQFVLKLMKEERYEKSIQVLDALKDKYDINQAVINVHSAAVCPLYCLLLFLFLFLCVVAMN